MRATIATTGRFQPAFVWAAYLERREQLERIVTPMPFNRVSDFGVSKERTCSLVPLAAWSYAVRRLGQGASPRALELSQFLRTVSFDISVSRLLGRCDVFNGWVGASLFSIRTARRRGIPAVLQTGSAHIVRQAELLREEAAKFGAGERITHPRVIARALREYEEADRIVVPSEFVHRTFVEKGVSPEKLVIVPWAAVSVVDAPQRSPAGKEGAVTVLYVGGCSLRKGIPYLLDAARRLGAEVNVRMVGPENPRLIARLGGVPPNVTIVGLRRGADLQDEFRRADIFVLPSVEDGSALVTLEAMLAGLPVVVSDQSGAALVDHEVSGYVVPARDAGALAERILALARDPAARSTVGAAGRVAAAPRTQEVYGDDLKRLVYQPLLHSG
jgi:glycosyltransferase involved in cell wall biosynthesis